MRNIKWTITVTPWDKDEGDMIANDYDISIDLDSSYDEIFLYVTSFENIEDMKKKALDYYNQAYQKKG